MRTYALVHGWLVAAATLQGAAQDLTVLPPMPGGPVYIHNAILHTVSDGDIEGGALLLRNGKIEAVWRRDDERTIAADTTIVIDAQGQHVWPGLVSPWTALGVSEVGSLPDTIDVDEVGDLNPEVYASLAVNPDATAIAVTRLNGVLSAGVAPRGGLVCGHLSVLSLAGWTTDDMTVRADAGLVLEWPDEAPPARRQRGRPDPEQARARAKAALAALDALWAQARGYAAARAADDSTTIDIRLEGMLPSLAGRTPVFVLANTRDQIERCVDWAERQGLRLVIVGAEAALTCADLLRARDVAVVLATPHRLPTRRDAEYDETFTLPGRVQAAGLRWCLAHEFGGFANERNLPYAMGTAIAFGLDRAAALRAMTLSAAEILGVADRLGALRPGMDATLFVSTGDPWELDTEIRQVWIGGRMLDLVSKQTELADKYREKYRQLGSR